MRNRSFRGNSTGLMPPLLLGDHVEFLPSPTFGQRQGDYAPAPSRFQVSTISTPLPRSLATYLLKTHIERPPTTSRAQQHPRLHIDLLRPISYSIFISLPGLMDSYRTEYLPSHPTLM